MLRHKNYLMNHGAMDFVIRGLWFDKIRGRYLDARLRGKG